MAPGPSRRRDSCSSDLLSLASIPEDSLLSSGDELASIDSNDSAIPRIDRSRRYSQNCSKDLIDSIPVILTTTTRRKMDDVDDDDIETASAVSYRSNRSQLSIKEQKRGIDEVYLMYSRAENAALMIQRKFRDRHPELAKEMADHDDDDGDDCVLENEEKEEDEGPSKQQMLTWLFITCFMFVPILVGWCGKCLKMFEKMSGSDGAVDDGGVGAEIAKEGAGTYGGGGGGPGGGGSGPNPVQAMAGQAAGAASAGAAAGVAAGAAAAGAALGAAAGAAGAGAAAAASTVGVAAAAAVTVVGVSIATGALDITNKVTNVPIVSACGISDPQVVPGRATFLLEGFYREFDDRETTLLEGLLVEAYNNITLGPERDLCQDKYLRELQSARLINQTFFPQTEVNNSYIETTFETSTLCQGCPSDNPMFGDAERTARRRSLQDQLSSADFFHLFLQNLLLDVKQMSDDREIMEGFLQMKRGYIVDTSSGEESMLTDISTTFNEAGEVSTLTLAYADRGVSTTVKTVNVIPPVEADETEAPSVAVSAEPTIVESVEPTTPEPSSSPSLSFMPSATNATSYPSGNPSIIPSEFPSASPSDTPSKEPTISPSAHPTINFSGQPTHEPSNSPTNAPSVIPSQSPSTVPSVIPSDQPSWNPSAQPSDIPSVVPSESPSMNPSIVPSIIPSTAPSLVPSSSPSRSPTMSPSKSPTASPTLSVRPTPCIWRAAERKQGGAIGSGPQTCTGTDYTVHHASVHIYDQSQDGETVSFRVHWGHFQGTVMSLAALKYDSSSSADGTSTCDYMTGSFTNRNFHGVCTNGQLEVIFYFYMCGEEVNVASCDSFCSTPSDLRNYREYRYLLDCYEVCETEGPTSGPTSAPTESLPPTVFPSARPSPSPSSMPSQSPSISAIPSRSPTLSPNSVPTTSNNPTTAPEPTATPTVKVHPNK